MFKRGDISKVSEYFRSTTLQYNGFVGRGELFSAEGFLLGLYGPFLVKCGTITITQES